MSEKNLTKEAAIETCKRILTAWMCRPEQRLGQLLINVARHSENGLWNVRDEEWGPLFDKAEEEFELSELKKRGYKT